MTVHLPVTVPGWHDAVRMDERTRWELCWDSLVGLSVGDALGAQFFVPGRSVEALVAGDPPGGPWEWTDDTEMACSVVDELRHGPEVDRERLAAAFAERCEPYRGYGGGAVRVLHRIRDGIGWREAAREAFDGEGSCGNGAAMRVAPLGAYLAGDPAAAAHRAMRTAEVTHAHPEGVLGAAAVAVAAAVAAEGRHTARRPTAADLLAAVDGYLVDGAVRRGIRRAARLPAVSTVDGPDRGPGGGSRLGAAVAEAAYELGNGARVTAQDTVPFAVWVAGTLLDDYPAAITACVVAGGDVDTTGAIVGGIVAAYTGIGERDGVRGVPAGWLARREALPDWVRPG
jgi:ADP-ribosylglycohydrolase